MTTSPGAQQGRQSRPFTPLNSFRSHCLPGSRGAKGVRNLLNPSRIPRYSESSPACSREAHCEGTWGHGVADSV